jgi:1-deoxyxylulose-5-phosphate synthase
MAPILRVPPSGSKRGDARAGGVGGGMLVTSDHVADETLTTLTWKNRPRFFQAGEMAVERGGTGRIVAGGRSARPGVAGRAHGCGHASDERRKTMSPMRMNRRQFLGRSAAMAAAAAAAARPASAAEGARTATDQVTLGKTGLKLSRVGMGTGSQSGQVQFDLGPEKFNRLVRYAYDHGITYFDCAKNYKTYPWIGGAIKGLPREKLFILSKIGGNPERPGEVIDEILKTYQTDYVDCLLVHCATKDTWTDDVKRLKDAIDEAQAKKKVRAKGVSCHSLPALRVAAKSDWVQVNLVRVNPQAAHIDGETPEWNKPGTDIAPVLKEIDAMKERGHGIIGMKICGNGDFTEAGDREKSIRFAMAHSQIDAITIGLKSEAEVDEAIERMNRALAGA